MTMADKTIQLVQHAPGAPGLRLLGLGPNFVPMRGLIKLKLLFDNYAFWAKGRTKPQLQHLLAGSNVIISLWQGPRIVGFGRATSDGIYRAVLWDIVVAEDLQGLGLGRKVVNALLNAKQIRNVEKTYLMTTKGYEFYKQLGFQQSKTQNLLILKKTDVKYPI